LYPEIVHFLLMQNFYFRSKTTAAKEKIGKYAKISQIYRDNFSPSNVIGNCTNLYRKLQPKDDKDFCDKYFKYASENKSLPIRDRGLTYEEYEATVKRYMELANACDEETFEYEDYFYDLLCHIITETYDGQQNEREFREFLTKLGYECDYFDGKIDAYYGLDIKVTRNDGKLSAIQIKPISFFKSTRTDVHRDRINLVAKYYNALNDLGIKTYYAIYYKDKKTNTILWLKNGNGYRFKLNELFSYDLKNIEKTLSVKYLKDDYHLLGT